MIEVRNVFKSYDGSTSVLDGLSLDVKDGEFVTLLGPSGCGKTTLLKMINKLILCDKGNIKFKGKNLEAWDTIKLRRSIGYVIQQIGLFPHMNIEDNIGYVLSLEGVKTAERHEKAVELIELVGMDRDMLNRYPTELSGGQSQRVGVARALAADPEVVLMDEPFGAVDEIARTALQDELLALQKKLGKTILFVTHDIQEALKLGSKIVLLKDGRVEQAGTKEALLFEPASDFVKNFLGLKGFKSILNEGIMNEIYEKVVSEHKTMDEVYSKLQEI
ncbi:ATP-binding cassette domain-containing protein [Oceanispirochaeta crateris]|uniref:ATP-binding cassette domain-containing protein n=1 Tax=Oceanispirochaeta crateris TaxID=2518645 RepID=A0A5C1QLF1_9SPIO|nr:ATP-binding cassette domain-containing protein [Oceanispirochaeta crateris]QEN08995.1 ATP-binding cassette domain-containing protein [Oceanispirochaeta crateris]